MKRKSNRILNLIEFVFVFHPKIIFFSTNKPYILYIRKATDGKIIQKYSNSVFKLDLLKTKYNRIFK